MRDGFVYVVQSLQLDWIKIGWAKCIARRMVAVARFTGSDLTLLASMRGTQADETSLHRAFAHQRIAFDWFVPGDDLLAHVRTWPRLIEVSFVGSGHRGRHRFLFGRLAFATGARRGPHFALVAPYSRAA